MVTLTACPLPVTRPPSHAAKDEAEPEAAKHESRSRSKHEASTKRARSRYPRQQLVCNARTVRLSCVTAGVVETCHSTSTTTRSGRAGMAPTEAQSTASSRPALAPGPRATTTWAQPLAAS